MIFVLFCTVLVKMCTILYRFSQNLYYFVPFLIILYPNTQKNFALRAYPARKMIYFYTYLMLKGPIYISGYKRLHFGTVTHCVISLISDTCMCIVFIYEHILYVNIITTCSRSIRRYCISLLIV